MKRRKKIFFVEFKEELLKIKASITPILGVKGMGGEGGWVIPPSQIIDITT